MPSSDLSSLPPAVQFSRRAGPARPLPHGDVIRQRRSPANDADMAAIAGSIPLDLVKAPAESIHFAAGHAEPSSRMPCLSCTTSRGGDRPSEPLAARLLDGPREHECRPRSLPLCPPSSGAPAAKPCRRDARCSLRARLLDRCLADVPAAEAQLRDCRADQPAAGMIGRRGADWPSQSGCRQATRRRGIFPRVRPRRVAATTLRGIRGPGPGEVG